MTLVDEDTNSIPTNYANRTIQGNNVAMQVVPSGGQRGRGLWKAWSEYGRSVCFWYFQVFKLTQNRTTTPMPTEIDEEILLEP